jgi:small subunit ribosomal protein S4
MRALGVELPGLSRKNLERRPYPPGQHGAKGKKKPSVYGMQLMEKQKLRYNYCIGERHLRKLMSDALRSRGNPGVKLVEFLERRLDNAVFRAGFAATILAARQLVSHGHVRVNGKRVTISSYRVEPGETFTLTEKAMKMTAVQGVMENPPLKRPNWLEVGADHMAKVVSAPTSEEIGFPVDIPQVVEFYSRRVK